jgi:hypothetical protein
VLRKTQLSLGQILELCVGDSLDADAGRKAFPRTKADLVAAPRGQEMFDIARQGLVEMAKHIPGFKGVAARPNKFCHGFGIFQLDLQFFREDPDYFLERRYADFDASLQKCLGELRRAIKKVPGLEGKSTLNDFEAACVAIAYNTGGFKPSRGLQQGFRPKGGKFYGEQMFDFLRLSKSVATPGSAGAVLSQPPPGTAAVSPPSPVEATGPFFEVDVESTPLRLRSAAVIDKNAPNANVKARLPDGQIVRAVTGETSASSRRLNSSSQPKAPS